MSEIEMGAFGTQMQVLLHCATTHALFSAKRKMTFLSLHLAIPSCHILLLAIVGQYLQVHSLPPYHIEKISYTETKTIPEIPSYIPCTILIAKIHSID